MRKISTPPDVYVRLQVSILRGGPGFPCSRGARPGFTGVFGTTAGGRECACADDSVAELEEDTPSPVLVMFPARGLEVTADIQMHGRISRDIRALVRSDRLALVTLPRESGGKAVASFSEAGRSRSLPVAPRHA